MLLQSGQGHVDCCYTLAGPLGASASRPASGAAVVRAGRLQLLLGKNSAHHQR